MVLGLIPSKLKSIHQKKEKDFTRDRKLPLRKLIVFILSITSSGKSKGVDSKSGEFFKSARRSSLWPSAQAIHRSSLTKARKKITWKVFEDIFHSAVKLAYEVWPQRGHDTGDKGDTWNGMSVYAIDGSKYSLPATKEMRKEFDSGSGWENPSRGHYPQCLVSTVYDVFRRFPVGRTVVAYNSCERKQAKILIPKIPPGNLLLLDKGYPSFEIFEFINKNYDGYFIIRTPAYSSFAAVTKFIKSNKAEDVILLPPSQSYLRKCKLSSQEKKEIEPLRLRVIRLKAPDGKISVLFTSLLDKKQFACKEIIELYFRRWELESYYRHEKIFIDIDTFHSRTVNGIRQELFAAVIMSVITRILIVKAKGNVNTMEPGQLKRIKKESGSGTFDAFAQKISKQKQRTKTMPEAQFKNAVMTLAAEAAILTPDKPEVAVVLFKEILEEIRRVKYYRPKIPRPSKPRLTKRPNNKWAGRNPKAMKKKLYA